MKTIIHFFIICTILFSFLGLNTTWAASCGIPSTLKVLKKPPEGVTVRGNKLILKEGYMFEKVSKNRVNLKSRANGGTGITGTFDCTCNGKSGGCDVTVTPTSASCSVSTCTSSCYMIVTIPGGTQGVLLRK